MERVVPDERAGVQRAVRTRPHLEQPIGVVQEQETAVAGVEGHVDRVLDRCGDPRRADPVREGPEFERLEHDDVGRRLAGIRLDDVEGVARGRERQPSRRCDASPLEVEHLNLPDDGCAARRKRLVRRCGGAHRKEDAEGARDNEHGGGNSHERAWCYRVFAHVVACVRSLDQAPTSSPQRNDAAQPLSQRTAKSESCKTGRVRAIRELLRGF
jgi:hypothetical protein